ncbi:HPr family phosphocarrier protein [Heyndrickxia sp. NPDC080065]|uniref:HPr family phosphocarrier protein n=1 Tax=Heyndrickxia sp. NPDC080065 TaxID=3390568 RepID=UPI003D015EED
MLIRNVVVQQSRGLQAENSVKLVEIGSSFNSEITIIKNGISAELDIIEIFNLNVEEGQEITLIVIGLHERYAIEVLADYLMDKL